MLRLITFDIRGTLIKELASVGDQYCFALNNFLSIKADSSELSETFWKVYKTHMRNSPLFGHIEKIPAKQWWYRVFVATMIEAQVISHSNINTQKLPKQRVDGLPDNLTNIDQAFEYVYDNYQWKKTPHSKELLQDINKLKAKHPLHVGVISNTDDRAANVLQTKGLLNYLDFIVTSYEVGVEKPDPKIFKHALNQGSTLLKQDLKPIQMLHIGDHLNNDYFGAKDFGCHCLLLDPLCVHKENKKVQHEHCIENLTHVMPYIKALT